MASTNDNVTTQTAVPAATSEIPVQSAPGIMESLVPLVLMLVAFYFLLIRPAQKREAKRKQLVSLAKRGDKVVTAGGIIGRIHKPVSDREISLEIAEGVRIRVLKSSILEILDKNSTLGAEDAGEIENAHPKKVLKISQQEGKKEEIA